MNEAEQPIFTHENEMTFTDYLSRQPIKDPFSFSFDLDAFRIEHKDVTRDVIRNPTKYYRIIKQYLIKSLTGKDTVDYLSKVVHYSISFEGNLGSNFVTPRGLSSKMANELVGLQGIVTKMDIVRYQLEKSVQWCDKSKSSQVSNYHDPLAPESGFQINAARRIHPFDKNSNPLEFEFGLSSFRNIQTGVVQELPEMAPPGLLPQSITVVLQEHLVNKMKPGDRVQMIGIYRLIPGIQSKQKGIFKTIFLCLSIKPLYMSIPPSKMTANKPCAEDELLPLFSRSIAPSIEGHEQLKKAVLLMLLGGCEKVLDNGTHLRGDINILMVGDPGTAKSQILRWILSTVDVGIGTTGSGASGVGLTAAIVNDRESGEKTLEAGAMVLADRGVVCIDQFDKMNEIDRVAVHEVMQQQTVTIAKAGVHCSLNARCSVVAAANPMFGEYQADKLPTKNIGMPDSLLSRFDLIFIVLDEINPERDRRIAERVCLNHRLAPLNNQFNYQFREEDEFVIQPLEDNGKTESNDIVFEKSNVFKSDISIEILTQKFLKKYINYCKSNIHPVLTDDSITLLASMWALLRKKYQEASNNKVLPITIRSNETLIRLSTAHAKLRQSNHVELLDCLEGFKLMSFCLHGSCDALSTEVEQIMKENSFSLPQVNKSKMMDIEETEKTGKKRKKGRPKKKEEEELLKGIEKIQIGKDEKQVDEMLMQSTVRSQYPQLSQVFHVIIELNKQSRGAGFPKAKLTQSLKNKKISSVELNNILEQLDKRGKIHIDSDDKIHL